MGNRMNPISRCFFPSKAVLSTAGLLAFSCVAMAVSITPASTTAAPTTVASVNESTNSKAGRLKTVTVTGKREYTPSLVEASVSGSRLELTPQEIPASIDILSGDTIRALADASVALAVSRATGVSAFVSPGDGGTALASRGFVGHDSVMQLFDGSQISVAAGTVTFPFDTWAIDHVEVLRGPSSVLYGQGAIGGAINVVPKKPSRVQSSELEVAYGSYDSRRLSFDSTGPLGDAVSYRLDANRRKSNGWVDRGDSESLAISGALRWDITSNLAVTLSHDSGHQEPEGYFGTPLVNGKLDSSLRANNYNVRDNVLEYNDRWTRLKVDWDVNDSVKISSEAYRLVSKRHWRNVESYYWNADTGLIDREGYYEIRHDETQAGDRTVAVFNHELSGLENGLAVGFDVNTINFRYHDDFLTDAYSTVDIDNSDPGYFTNSAAIPSFKTDTDQRAIFAEDRLQLTKRWTLVAGYRHDSADFERKGLRPPFSGFDKDFSSSSWRLGSVFDLSENLSLYGLYSTGADPVGSLVTTSASREHFDITKAKQAEIGLKQVFMDNRGEWTLSLYSIEKDDLLTSDPTDPSRTVQVGQQSSNGVEIATDIRIADSLTLSANATVLNAKYDEFAETNDDTGELISYQGNVPVGSPEKMANVWLLWDVDSAWQVNTGVRYVGKRYSDNANDYELPDFTVVDAGVKWKPLRKTTLALNLLNAFDKDYAVASYGSGQWILGAPRTVEASVNVKF
jgi:iron complex outermembrane recepter protein